MKKLLKKNYQNCQEQVFNLNRLPIRLKYEIVVNNKKKTYNHSAVVYAVEGDDERFMQVSGGSNNLISIGNGFTDGHYQNVTSIDQLKQLKGVRICRYIPKESDIED